MKAIEQNGFIFEMESYDRIMGCCEEVRNDFNEILNYKQVINLEVNNIIFKQIYENLKIFTDRTIDTSIEIKLLDNRVKLLLRNAINYIPIFKISFPNENEAIKFANHIVSFKLNCLMKHLNKYIKQ